jgi:5'(3')-deoxyribonucleotidase
MNIGIDMDEVLFPFTDNFIIFYNKKYGKNVKKDDFFSYEFEDALNIPLSQVLEDVYGFMESPLFENARPIAGSQEGVMELKKKGDLYIITGRSNRVIGRTKEWTEKYFNNSFKEICFADFHPFVRMQMNPKHKICSEKNIDLLIEDIPKYAFGCAEKNENLKVLVMDYPWNRNYEFCGRIKRVKDWKEIINYAKDNL